MNLSALQTVLLAVVPAGPLYALTAALLWGGGDFSGGMGVKQAGGSMRAALRVVLLSHATSFFVLLIAASLRGDAFPHGAPLYWGLAAGVAGGLSLTCFYVALSRGAMGVSAAVSGLLAAAIPAVVSMTQEGSPGALHLVGFAVAGIAIWLIAAGPSPENTAPNQQGTMTLAVASGIGFGLYFVGLKYAGPAGLVWSMASCRIGSLTICSLVLLAVTRGRSGPDLHLQLPRKAVLWCLSAALLDTSGNLFFVAATRAGRLDIAAVLASLYPASTILLAAWTLHEKPTRRQALGMGIAAAAVTMIAL
jgi:drug/metabolite transporter (DMT)-like permease